MSTATSESALLRAATRWLRAQPNVWWVKVHGTPFGRAGVPDLLICVRGRLIAIELKTPGRRATPLQERELAALRNAGAFAATVWSLDELQQIVALA